MGQLAAIYCRLSWAPDGSVEKVDRQEEDCRKLAERLDWTVSEEHVYKQDNHASAWKRTRRRKGWEAMLAAAPDSPPRQGHSETLLQAARTLRLWAADRQKAHGQWTAQEQAAIECATRMEGWQ